MTLALLLGGFQWVLVVIAGELSRTNGFLQLAALVPAAVQEMAGGTVFTSFSGLAAFGFFHPIVILVFCGAAIFLASEPAGDIEAGLVDLILARPVPRAIALARTLIACIGSIAGVALVMALSQRAALRLLAPDAASLPSLRTTLLLAVNLMALGSWFGAASLLVSAAARRRATAVGIASAGAVGLYLASLVSQLWSRARPYGLLMPYHYFDAPAILRGTAAWPRDIAILLITGALMAVAAFRVYAERDL